MFITLKRIIKSGWQDFWRNKWLSSAAVIVVAITIIGLTTLLLINVLITSLTDGLEDKIDISVYFDPETSEEDILAVRNDLIQMDEVKSIEYVSTDEALKRFRKKHQNNEILMQSLNELGSNPLEASLNIKAQQASQYASIADFFNQETYQNIVNKINYSENKEVIARLSLITRNIRRVGFAILMVLACLAVLVTFNTIRLTIYSARKEIRVMKLVGASNWFAQGPFLVEGVLYGVFSALTAMLVLYPLLWYISPSITHYLPGTDLFYFFQKNFFVFFLIQLTAGMGLGVISSWMAVRRYLSV